MAYRIAGIDVHKKMLAVVVADVEGEGECHVERRQFGTTPDHLRLLSDWFVAQEVEEVVIESTAQYWKPVWGALEQYWKPTWQRREGLARCQDRCIWHRRNPIADRRGGRRISPMRNDW